MSMKAQFKHKNPRLLPRENESVTETNQAAPSNTSLITGLAMVGGLGLTIIVVALGVGVIVPDADNNFVGLAVLTGLIMLIGAIGGWLAVVQPFTHFDDINVPAADEHHHDSHADDHAEAAPATH
jgi:protein-S-isoprenylcysteine O-methyltransferase Ste14